MKNEDQLQERASGMQALAEAKFGKLSDAEKLLLGKVRSGDVAVCGPKHSDDDPDNDPQRADGWGRTRQIRAELLGWLCTDEQPRKRVHWRGIRVYGADVTGRLVLSFVNIPFPLVIQHSRLKGGIDLSGAEVSELDLQGSLVHGITAEDVRVKNEVFLNNRFAAVGEVGLIGAQIGGTLDCDAGTFTNPTGKAIDADLINVKGDVFLRDGFTASGEVMFLGAKSAVISSASKEPLQTQPAPRSARTESMLRATFFFVTALPLTAK